MKILLLNQAFHPDVVFTAQHLSELATALAERRHQATVVTGWRAYDEPVKLFTARENWHGVRKPQILWQRQSPQHFEKAFCCQN